MNWTNNINRPTTFTLVVRSYLHHAKLCRFTCSFFIGRRVSKYVCLIGSVDLLLSHCAVRTVSVEMKPILSSLRASFLFYEWRRKVEYQNMSQSNF